MNPSHGKIGIVGMGDTTPLRKKITEALRENPNARELTILDPHGANPQVSASKLRETTSGILLVEEPRAPDLKKFKAAELMIRKLNPDDIKKSNEPFWRNLKPRHR